MKDLERIFYGNIVAYDAAIVPEAKQDELPNVIWRNVFSDDGSLKPDAAAAQTVQACTHYAPYYCYIQSCWICSSIISDIAP
uniref:Ubiquinol-cytochrome c chaperone domain-containing protein n=1 Tax=Cannabis sativa TaxID=3483 RepID=A0A803RBZ9_CANSA